MGIMTEAGLSSIDFARYVHPSKVGRTMRKDLEMAIRLSEPEWHGRTDFETLYEDALDENNLLFVVEDGGQYVAFMLCGLYDLTTGKLLEVQWSGGRKVLAHLPKLVASAEHAAQLLEATYIQMTGRPAWVRLLNPYGFKPTTLNIGKVPDYVSKPKAAEGHADDEAGAEPGTARADEPGHGDDQAGSREPPDHAGGAGV